MPRRASNWLWRWCITARCSSCTGTTVPRTAATNRNWNFSNGLQPRTLDIPFNFLPAGKKYVAHIYRDGTMKTPTRTKVEVETRTVDANTVLPAKLYGSGGLAIRLEPAEPGKR